MTTTEPTYCPRCHRKVTAFNNGKVRPHVARPADTVSGLCQECQPEPAPMVSRRRAGRR